MTTRATGAATAPALLRIAEDELQRLRAHMAAVAAFIHDPTYDLSARRALACLVKIPQPAPPGRTASKGERHEVSPLGLLSTNGAGDRHGVLDAAGGPLRS